MENPTGQPFLLPDNPPPAPPPSWDYGLRGHFGSTASRNDTLLENRSIPTATTRIGQSEPWIPQHHFAYTGSRPEVYQNSFLLQTRPIPTTTTSIGQSAPLAPHPSQRTAINDLIEKTVMRKKATETRELRAQTTKRYREGQKRKLYELEQDRGDRNLENNRKVFLHSGIDKEWGVVFAVTILFFIGAESWKWAKWVYLRKHNLMQKKGAGTTEKDSEKMVFEKFYSSDSDSASDKKH
ncbi:hypothetical protein QBC38DRAFT_522606 [Podospora fimiseda]|uniref:Uncharacterized protein n=1 Tax=Podospora fimiseda TaxID=252190 RepID=A0AAN6YLA7_9PEZI|nr:hypothetical protein QBC38DRAFT_522606 [Podospora fimiseda]